MSIVANPEALRALARSCSGASFDIRYNAKLFVDRSQGTSTWRGSAAQAFLQTTEHLHEDYRIVSVTLDDAAGVLHALAGQMDHVIHLRQQAQHLYQSIAHMRPETPDQHDYVNEQRWRAQDLQNQAEVLAQEADRRASAKIEPQHLKTGSATNQASRDLARALGTPTDDAGHAIGSQLGGLGGATSGIIFPQAPSINRGRFRDFEDEIAELVKEGKQVFIRVVPKYENGSTRPTEILYQVRIEGKTISKVFPNP
ncbi:DNA/RNA non-specific endonuclease [Tumebacillus permanentifrigoris]|uniref:DNA/RNA non-specific endonuclease n=1 Tax=Tumebacillus permanentifrigoris TaxID=378543 RepID=A0A316DX90_9BACL|nr:DNA/RNA non-specific endonuclease [Tumebacillus permanentifrigoris]PWK14454.1 DNA/RNA non-specific endonuclease [Tumebacillus permanentifrigoris]